MPAKVKVTKEIMTILCVRVVKKGSATERCTHANDRYLYMITRRPTIKTAAIS